VNVASSSTTRDYSHVTETAEALITSEAVAMMYTRYCLAASHSRDKRVLEVGCGSGQGLPYLAKHARVVVGGDYTPQVLLQANPTVGQYAQLVALDGHKLPFVDGSFDLILLYEAIYYLADPRQFLDDCRRVLRPGGMVLICTANKDRPDFNPSPHAHRYYSARDLAALLRDHGFSVELFGGFPVSISSLRDLIVFAIRKTAVALHLIPKGMGSKALLKRLFLGKLRRVSVVTDDMAPYHAPAPISDDSATTRFKVLYAVAKLLGPSA